MGSIPKANPAKKGCCTPSASLVAGARGGAPGATTPLREGPRGIDTTITTVPTQEPVPFADRGSTDGMVRVPGGEFLMGNDQDDAFAGDGEGPVRTVRVPAFYVDTTAVTTESFARFVEATGYVTDAEKFGWSFVFHTHLSRKYAQTLRRTNAVVGLEWWLAVPGAFWRRPFGERSNTKDLLDHPVVHVSWNDAVSYCRWAGKRLATEAQWEFAARGGLEAARYPWGNDLVPRGRHRCNIWQGKFPDVDTGEDGFKGTCPVDAFEPNGYGLFNVSGNVWEWCSEWFSPDHHVPETPETRENPQGPTRGDRKIQKGGSFLCHHSYCNRYRVAARTGNTPDSSSGNSGFRCVRDV